MYKFIEREIKWIVVLSIVFVTTLNILESVLKIQGYGYIGIFLTFINFFLILLLLIYQKNHYGFVFGGKLFAYFYLYYSLVVLLDLTIMRKYPLDQLRDSPGSLFFFFLSFFKMLGYFLCAESIAKEFDTKKFLLISFLVCTISSILYINFVGFDVIQESSLSVDDSFFISSLRLGFTNSTIAVISLLLIKDQISSKFSGIIFPLIVFVASVFILLALGKRGPIIYTIINSITCLFLTLQKRRLKYLFLSTLLGIILYLNFDTILSEISSIAPTTVERIQLTIYEGDTSKRIDFNDMNNSCFIIGLDNFASSPIIGSYFRLITNNYIFKGHYPHNIFIEVLMTVGIVGFIPFMYLLFKTFYNAIHLFNRRYNLDQLVIFSIFLSYFLMLQTSKSLLFRTEFWLPFYIICYSAIPSKRVITLK